MAMAFLFRAVHSMIIYNILPVGATAATVAATVGRFAAGQITQIR